MSPFHAILLGFLEGFTEFLPVSSTAHLVIGARLLELPSDGFLTSFIITIQLGAIASLLVLYRKTLISDHALVLRVVVAFLPAALVGFSLYSIIKNVFLESMTIITGALFIGGVIFILFERARLCGFIPTREIKVADMSLTHAVIIGCAQSLAVVPGVSRAGATILGGLALGLPRVEIARFSFLLAIPTMLAATGYDLLKTGSSFALSDWHLLLFGFLAAFFAAYISARALIHFVSTHSFEWFGWYRILLALFIFFFLL